jgi:uncharacterized membrane protein YcgQ (UPF0703/DUF1980 family)
MKTFVKKSLIISVFILAINAAFFITACSKTNNNKINSYDELDKESAEIDKGSVEIREKMFATQVSDVYINARDYLGKTIKLEGIFLAAQYSETDTFYSVMRYGPGGCCGIDGYFGFEIQWPKGSTKAFPNPNAWVKAAGQLKSYQVDYNEYLYIELSSLTELSKRGTEYVLQ